LKYFLFNNQIISGNYSKKKKKKKKKKRHSWYNLLGSFFYRNYALGLVTGQGLTLPTDKINGLKMSR